MTKDGPTPSKSTNVRGRGLSQALDLKIGDPLVKKLRITVRHLVAEILDGTRTYTQQESLKFAEIKRKISQDFPDIFDNPSLGSATQQKRMDAVMRVVRNHFLGMRRLAMLRAESNKPPKIEEPESIPQLNSPATPSPQSTRITQESPQQQSSTQGRVVPSQSYTTPAHKTSAPMSSQTSPRPPPYSQQISGSIVARMTGTDNVPAPPPSSTQSTSTTLVSSSLVPSASTPSSSAPLLLVPESRIDEVTAFLSSCVPDMQCFLESFIRFGCRNGQFLTAVATSADHEIEEFLKKVIAYAPPPQALGLVTEMDLWVLVKHFKAYLPAGSGPKAQK